MFWLRELAGWVLVALGLFVFYVCLGLLLSDRPRIIEAGPLTVIGFVVFRGGIHLLKVAVAARVCLQAQRTGEDKETRRQGDKEARKEKLSSPRPVVRGFFLLVSLSPCLLVC